MPQLLAPVLISVLGISAATATIAANVAFLLGGIAINAFVAANQKSDGPTSPDPVNQNIKEGAHPRYVVLGKARIGGVVFFADTDGKDFYTAIALSNDIVGGVESYYINGVEVLLDSNKFVTTPPFNFGGVKYIQLEQKFGFTNQTASTLLLNAFPGIWTSAHTASGVAYLVARCINPSQANYQTVYQTRLPQFEALVDGSLVYDPRNVAQDPNDPTTWAVTTNPALLAMHYLTSVQGMGLARSGIAGDTFSNVATYCDASITTKAGLSRKRYECGGYYTFDQDPVDVLNSILNTFAGRLYITPNGLIGLTCDDLDVANVTITPDMIVSCAVDDGPGALYEYTTIKTRFTSEAHGYIQSGEEADPWVNQAHKLIVGRDIAEQFDLPWVFRHDQARRLMKKRYYKLNPPSTVKLELDFHGLDLFGESVFNLNYPAIGLVGLFRIDSISTEPGFGKISVEASQVDPASLTWDAASEEGTGPAIPPSISTSGAPSAPVITSAFVGNTGGATNQAIINWTNTITATQAQEAQWKPTSGSTWMQLTLTPDQRSVILTGLTAGISYDFEIRATDPTYGVSNWATTSVTANASAGTTGPLATATASGGVNSISYSAKQGNYPAAAYVETVVISHGGTLSWTGSTITACGANSSISKTIGSSAGSYDVYIRSVGANGDVSTPSMITVSVSQQTSTAGTGGSGSSSGGGSGGSNSGQGTTGTSAPHPLYG